MNSRRRATTGVSALLVACGLAACGDVGAHSATTHPTVRHTVGHPIVDTFGVAANHGPVTATLHEKPTPIAGIVGTVVQVATSNSDTYALTSTGTVWAWGVANDGELGDGSTPAYTGTAKEVDFPSGVTISELANPMPFDGALAIDSRGDAWGWGLNVSGDLCLQDRFAVLRPVRLPLSHVSLAAGARSHSLFDSNGSVYACGGDEYGALGNGSMTSSSTPTRVRGLPEGRVKALTASWGNSGALMDNGRYYDWGYNRAGQLGDGSTTDSDLPVHVNLPAAVVQVFQGGSGATNGQTLAIVAGDSLWAWGNGTDGQLGDSSKSSSTVPIRVRLPGGAKAVKVASGGSACYAIDKAGRLWAWGRNNFGQLGTGSAGPDRLRPLLTRISLSEVSSTAQNVAGLAGG
ncbi:MAG: RCC1 domain-containing protein [Acidimicrobiales bacterium]